MSILNIIWKKSRMCLRNSILKGQRERDRRKLVSGMILPVLQMCPDVAVKCNKSMHPSLLLNMQFNFKNRDSEPFFKKQMTDRFVTTQLSNQRLRESSVELYGDITHIYVSKHADGNK